jgi:hypothetical protein
LSDDEEMPDDDDPSIPMIVPLPPEVQAQLQAQVDRQQMSSNAFSHEVIDFMKRLDGDDLMTLRKMLVEVSDGSDRNDAIINYWAGLTTSILDLAHNICAACGKNHDELLAELGQEDHNDDD